MTDELFSLYKRNFPFIIKDDESVKQILSHKSNVIIEKRNGNGKLIGAAVVNRSTIIMLCVDKEYRGQGIGSALLTEAEEVVKKAGRKSINVGVGFNYLMPGVPTSKHYYPSVNERLSDGVEANASEFFEKRGYFHDNDADIFDMLFPLSEFCKEEHSVAAVAFQKAAGFPVNGNVASVAMLNALYADDAPACGKPAEIQNNKLVQEAYLGVNKEEE